VSVIQILDDADVAFRISGAELRTVLSATTMLADKPHRLNGRTSVQRVYVLTILPPVTALTVGLPAQRAIAQRFRAVALTRRVSRSNKWLLVGLKQTQRGNGGTPDSDLDWSFPQKCQSGLLDSGSFC
jgi:hypothetical protein